MFSDQIKLSVLLKSTCLLLGLFCWQLIIAQKKIDLSDLKEFNNAGGNWHIAGDVKADYTKNHDLSFTPGSGILVNLPTPSDRKDLFTNLKHGDIDLELDCMMAKGSNSGIYLQGRYEIQLLDSWGVVNPRSSDMGGIYERYDNSRPEGQKNIDGHAPRQNTSKAPGLWQHMKISFQAPRFEGGIKVKNAKVLSIELNGILILENIELFAPTAGSVSEVEVASDALRIQGDHGQVAFKNIVITQMDKPKPVISDLWITVLKGNFEKFPDLTEKRGFLKEPTPIISTNIDGVPDNGFLARYLGIIHVKEAGNYKFRMVTKGGTGSLNINNQNLIYFGSSHQDSSINLPVGDYNFEVFFSKYMDWVKSSLIVYTEGPGIREFIISDPTNIPVDLPDPILVQANENTILRSFIDLPNKKRIVHAVNVGSPQKINYTFDMDNGSIFQLWRGDFLDATRMWTGRGDGTAKTLGSVLYLGPPAFPINKMSNANTPWKTDTTGMEFITKGYTLDDKGFPSFKFKILGATVTDKVKVLESGQGIQHEILVEKSAKDLSWRLADAKVIEEISPGLFLVDDKSYYVKVENSESLRPTIREQNGRKELIVPIQDKLTYSILY
ncbi:MAG: DUF1080 domain-containing protein [Chitinophagia bacterium]|nr:DUF1080 domain-containing protein [Chitinophagia bacterium]